MPGFAPKIVLASPSIIFTSDKIIFARCVDKIIFVRYFNEKIICQHEQGDNCMPIRITTGSPAEGSEKYFPRPAITEKIWRKIGNGEHLQLTAPRRVGKTSILKHLVQQPREGYLVKYIIVQSVDQENEFYKRLFNELVEDKKIFGQLEGYFRQASKVVKDYINRISAIGTNEVTFDNSASLDYESELKQLIRAIDDGCEKIILEVDEFPHAVENILKLDVRAGIHFLQSTREFRQDDRLSRKVQFIFTGSIGLGNIVKKIGQSNLIMDLAPVPVSPLSPEEAEFLIKEIVQGLKKFHNIDLPITETCIAYILEKIDWLIPYYIQIMIDELCDIYEEGLPINNQAVDEALLRIVKNKYKHDNYFEHWKSHLKISFDDLAQYNLAREVLNLLAMNQSIDKAVFHDLGIKHEVAEPQYVQGVLEYDGYINEHEGRFCFNSPILKAWWYKNVAI